MEEKTKIWRPEVIAVFGKCKVCGKERYVDRKGVCIFCWMDSLKKRKEK